MALYEFDFLDYTLSEEDLKKIEDRMLALAREKQTFQAQGSN